MRIAVSNQNSTRLLLGYGLGIQIGLLVLIGFGNLTQHSGAFIGVVVVLSVLFWSACTLVLKQAAKAGSNKVDCRTTLLVIFFFAVLFRITTLCAAPTLSEDQFRYTWEGRLVTFGISPYRYAPADPALEPYRSSIWPLVQEPDTPSPYPPFAQVVNAVEYKLFGESLLGPKIAAVFFDILTCLALLWLLNLYRLDWRRVIIYAWCPLPIVEFGQSGHNDGPMLFFLLIAIGLALKAKPIQSSIVLGLASLAKFTPLFVLPLFLVTWHQARTKAQTEITTFDTKWSWWAGLRWQNWGYPALTLLTVLVGYAPFVIMGQGAIGSILDYTGSWRDNDALLSSFITDSAGTLPSKVFSLLVLAVTVFVLAFHPSLSQKLSLPRRVMLTFGVTLLVASTVHAWYITWIIVLLPLVYQKRSVFAVWDKAWLLFAALVELPYLTYAGDGSPYVWVKPLEFWPLYLATAWSVVMVWRQRRARSTLDKFINKKEIINDD